MQQINRARAERVGDLLRRYMWARSRCVGGEALSGQLSQLASRLQWGPCEFDGVRVELNLEPSLVWDRDQPEFFRAIIGGDNTVMSELEDLSSWRAYVHSNGPMPKETALKIPPGSLAGERRHSARIDVV